MKRLLCVAFALLLLCGCAAAPAGTTVPPTTAPAAAEPVLKPGYYTAVDEEYAASLMYIRLLEDGNGILSMLAMPQELTWTSAAGDFQGMALIPNREGLTLKDSIPLDFAYVGDALPDGFLPDPPAPGLYAISSVGYGGDVSFYGAATMDNGYLELQKDGTGKLVFRDIEYPFTLEGIVARFDGWSMTLMPRAAEEIVDVTMLVGYSYDGVIEAHSIVFHLLEVCP